MGKISGPLLDRIDMHIEVPRVKYQELHSEKEGESSAEVKKRVERARHIQRERSGKNTAIQRKGLSGNNYFYICNAVMSSVEVRKFCILTRDAEKLLRSAFKSLHLTARAHDRILKVACTIADLDGGEKINSTHVAEAVQYRGLDRKYWGC